MKCLWELFRCYPSINIPASAKIMRNNVFIYWLRYDEKYSYKNGKFICDSEFNGRAFTKDDF